MWVLEGTDNMLIMPVADKMLAAGTTMATIQEILSQAAAADNAEGVQRPGSASSTSGITQVTGLSSRDRGQTQRTEVFRSSQTRHSHPSSVAHKHKHNIVELEVGSKSCIVIEVEQDEEDQAACEGQEASADGGSQEAAKASKRSLQHHITQGSHRGPPPADGSMRTEECFGATDKVATGSGVGRETGLHCGSRSGPPQAGSSEPDLLDVTTTELSLRCAQACDEVDSGGIGTAGDSGGIFPDDEADGIISASKDDGTSASCVDGGGINTGEDLGDQNYTTDTADMSDGMGLVITSVTSLQNSDINFDDDEVSG